MVPSRSKHKPPFRDASQTKANRIPAGKKHFPKKSLQQNNCETGKEEGHPEEEISSPTNRNEQPWEPEVVGQYKRHYV